MGRPKAKKQKKSAAERAMERRQSIQIDQETAEAESRFKALARGRLGSQSLLAGAPKPGAKQPASAAPQSRYGTISSPRPKKQKTAQQKVDEMA